MQVQKTRPGYKLVNWHFKRTYQILEDWQVLPFKDGIKFLTDYEANGSYAKLDEFAKVGVGKPYAWFVRSVDLQKNRIGLVDGNQYVNKSSYDFLSKTELHGGELLLMKVGSVGNVYLMPTIDVPATLGNNLYLIFTNDIFSSKFAYYWFKGDLGQSSLFRIASTTTLPSINKDNTKSSLVFFPPVKQQQKIASILSNVDSLIESYDKVIESTKRLKKGLMQQLLTKGIGHKKFKKVQLGMRYNQVKIPESWSVKKTGEICESVVPGRNKPSIFNGTIPWLTVDDLDEFFVTKSKKSLNITNEERKKCSGKIISPNSVIMSCVGDLGMVVINKVEVSMNQQLHGFVCSDEIEPIFLAFVLTNKRDYMRAIATTTTVPYMNKDNCESIPVQLPPINEQRQIFSIFLNLNYKIGNLELKKFIIKSQKKGLMQKLLTSQIRVKV